MAKIRESRISRFFNLDFPGLFPDVFQIIHIAEVDRRKPPEAEQVD